MNLGDSVKNFIKELIPYLVILLVVVLLRSYVITPVSVNGPSMQNTLYTDDVMLLYKLGKLDRYDIVVLWHDNDKLIKRLMGLPGEKIRIENGIVYVNDEEMKYFGTGTSFDFEEITLSDDEYFVMGDNHVDSLDSRYFGPVKRNDIIGTTNVIIFPFNHFGIVE